MAGPFGDAARLQTNVTASRAKNTTYTNNSGGTMTVRATFRCVITLAAGTATVQGKSDSATPPVTIASGIVGIQAGLLNEDNSALVSFSVANLAKYRIDTAETNGTVTLGAWFEEV